MTKLALIRKLTIKRFRGVEEFDWIPQPGINMILGGGDAGKTTVLEAIGLLLSPSNAAVISESDYWQRDNTQEFVIEAVVALPENSDISSQQKFSWPWSWDGKNAVLPTGPDDASNDAVISDDPVYRVRVRGTTELELVWEIVQPNDQADHFSVAVRRKIGLVRLSADDKNDRDLRLVYGSALDRLLADTALRARVGKKISELDLHDSLGDEGKKAIDKLDVRLSEAALPNDLELGLITSQGLSIGALIGLLAEKDGVSIPLTSWGAGTRRMVALEIASSMEKDKNVIIIDEIERGLEPYRLRKLIRDLGDGSSQVFLTTHSPVAVSTAMNAHLWYLDSKGKIGALPFKEIFSQQRRDPETFLAKVAVIAEGPTEVGFLSYMLTRVFDSDPLDSGVRVCDGQGNVATLRLLNALSSAGLLFAGFVDNEGQHFERWKAVKDRLGDGLLQWSEGCTEKNVIDSIPDDQLQELLKDDDGNFIGIRLRTLADRLGIEDKEFATIEKTLKSNDGTLRKLIIEAATGSIESAPKGSEKEWKSHSTHWYKSHSGGEQLAKKMIKLGGLVKISPDLLPLINAILKSAGRQPVEKLDP